METVNIHEAKTQLSRLLSRVELGEEIIISNRGVPVAKLVPLAPPQSRRQSLGRDLGLFTAELAQIRAEAGLDLVTLTLSAAAPALVPHTTPPS